MRCDEFARQVARLLLNLNFENHAALAFSGGLDSSIIAYLMRSRDPRLYTVGLKDSVDIKNAVEIAEILGLPHRIIEVNEESIIEGIRFLREANLGMNPLEISFELPLYFVMRHSEENVVYSGQGADELFGGYRKYMEAPHLMHVDAEKLLKFGVARELRIAEMLGKKLFYPYLSEEIVAISGNIPENCKIKDGVRKWVLRRAAEFIGIPEEIVNREKKAAQYGSGIWKLMRKMAKGRGMRIQEFVEKV